MNLYFSMIKNVPVFDSDFRCLSTNRGTIEFKQNKFGKGGLAVVYAPNGTGKSSFANLLNIKSSTDTQDFVACDEQNKNIVPESEAFHIVKDILNRNIIQGKETDYLVGEQIRKELELREFIENEINNVFIRLNRKYKEDYKISKVSHYFLEVLKDLEEYSTEYKYIRSLVNSQQKGSNISKDEFISFIRKAKKYADVNIDEQKKRYIIDSCEKNNSTKYLINLALNTIEINPLANQIEKNDDAITVLKKYPESRTCIVCDHDIKDVGELITSKTNERINTYNSLTDEAKELLDKVINDEYLGISDPFEIKRVVRDYIAGNNPLKIHELQKEMEFYVETISLELIKDLHQSIDDSTLFEKYDEYISLISNNPILDNEELLFIQEIISENIGKDIIIEREGTHSYKIKLDDENLIGGNPKNLKLSAGEQNFVSLAFDLLFARRSKCDYVVLDDPISSFDSVYKNKIAFCIVKFLEDKKQIVLTHNMDLIRLLEAQLKNCFNLYILSRVDGGENGFIQVKNQEKKILINLHDLVKLFQNKVDAKDESLYNNILDDKMFLISMIPFMRGYANISLDQNGNYTKLSTIMHGYENGKIDLALIYKQLFSYEFDRPIVVTTSDVLNINCDEIKIINDDSFPLLSETLKQSLLYLYLRMTVEKELVTLFNLRVDPGMTIAQIILESFKEKKEYDDIDININKEMIKYKVFFNSRKSLLNEFNHFEGNLSIFQPALDINQEALRKEKRDIEVILLKLNRFVNTYLKGIIQ